MPDLFAQLGPTVWLGAKIVVLIFLGIYVIFSFVIVKQVNLMTKTLELGLEQVIAVFAYLHLLFAISVFAISFLML